ncbi:unnamed protein product [Amoebophrya sp. A25]|nr:unnamed protein product [Amoebophrya sp. A25]|eukprot:GSA25T00010481001.1
MREVWRIGRELARLKEKFNILIAGAIPLDSGGSVSISAAGNGGLSTLGISTGALGGQLQRVSGGQGALALGDGISAGGPLAGGLPGGGVGGLPGPGVGGQRVESRSELEEKKEAAEDALEGLKDFVWKSLIQFVESLCSLGIADACPVKDLMLRAYSNPQRVAVLNGKLGSFMKSYQGIIVVGANAQLDTVRNVIGAIKSVMGPSSGSDLVEKMQQLQLTVKMGPSVPGDAAVKVRMTLEQLMLQFGGPEMAIRFMVELFLLAIGEPPSREFGLKVTEEQALSPVTGAAGLGAHVLASPGSMAGAGGLSSGKASGGVNGGREPSGRENTNGRGEGPGRAGRKPGGGGSVDQRADDVKNGGGGALPPQSGDEDRDGRPFNEGGGAVSGNGTPGNGGSSSGGGGQPSSAADGTGMAGGGRHPSGKSGGGGRRVHGSKGHGGDAGGHNPDQGPTAGPNGGKGLTPDKPGPQHVGEAGGNGGPKSNEGDDGAGGSLGGGGGGSSGGGGGGSSGGRGDTKSGGATGLGGRSSGGGRIIGGGTTGGAGGMSRPVSRPGGSAAAPEPVFVNAQGQVVGGKGVGDDGPGFDPNKKIAGGEGVASGGSSQGVAAGGGAAGGRVSPSGIASGGVNGGRERPSGEGDREDARRTTGDGGSSAGGEGQPSSAAGGTGMAGGGRDPSGKSGGGGRHGPGSGGAEVDGGGSSTKQSSGGGGYAWCCWRHGWSSEPRRADQEGRPEPRWRRRRWSRRQTWRRRFQKWRW